MGKQNHSRHTQSGPDIGWELFILKWLGILILVVFLYGIFMPDEEIVVEKLNPGPVEFYWDKAKREAIEKGTYRQNVGARGDQRKSQYKVNMPWPDIEPEVWIDMEKDGYNDDFD